MFFLSNIVKAENLVTNPSFEGLTSYKDENNIGFEDWEISRSPKTGIIKTWVETTNTHSGSKAFHWRTEAPNRNGISLNYVSNSSKKILIYENQYLEAGLWAYVIEGSAGSDISINFYNSTGGLMNRIWSYNDGLGGWNTGQWNIMSYLWYPSSLGQGNGYIPQGAKYAQIDVYCTWNSSGIRERIDDDVFVKLYDHLPSLKERLDKNFTNIKTIVDYNNFQGTSKLSYGAHVQGWEDFLSGGGNMSFPNYDFISKTAGDESTPYIDNNSAKFVKFTFGSSQIKSRYINLNGVTTLNLHGLNKAQNVVSGSSNWQKVMWIGRFYDENMAEIGGYYPDLGFWNGTFDWTLREKNYSVPANAKYYSFRIGLENSTGTTWWDDISIKDQNGNLLFNNSFEGSPTLWDIVDKLNFTHMRFQLGRDTESCNSWNETTNSCVQYDWKKFDRLIEAIKKVGAEPIIALPVGTWGNANNLPSGMLLNYSIYHPGTNGGFGYFPTLDSYCEYVKTIVKHANTEKRYNVRYWEVGNEPYVCNSTIASAYIDYFNLAERCMHEIDSTILLTSDRSIYKDFNDKYFIDNAKNVGFLTFHFYEIGATCMYPFNKSNINNEFYPPNDQNGWISDFNTMFKANKLSGGSGCWGSYSPRELKDLWKQKKGKDLEIIATEVNLNSAWQNGTDHRQNDIFGATWYAAKVKSYISDGGLDNINYFVLISGDATKPMAKYGGFGFGMMNSNYPYNPYAPYWANYLLTKYFPKESLIYNSQSSNPDGIDTLAVKNGNSYNIMLINKVNETINFSLPILGFTINNVILHVLDKTTYIQKYEPLIGKTIISKSSIDDIALSKNNVQNFTFDGYTVAVLEAFSDPAAPYITNITNIDLESITWNQDKYHAKAECSGENIIQIHSNNRPPIIKINGIDIPYDESLSLIPSWKYDETDKIINIKFLC